MEEEEGSRSVDYERVREWEDGLPSASDLTPLSQCLISPQLASAFSISSDIPPFRSADEVSRASHSMFALLKNTSLPALPSAAGRRPHPPPPAAPAALPPCSAGDETIMAPAADDLDALGPGSDSSEGPSRHDADADADVEPEEVESAPAGLDSSADDPSARTLKRPRLVWTPELHKRFIEAVAHLGIKNAVPKTIMQLMNVEGLTRENVASHLQKYRLYLKRMQGLSTDGPTSSDHLFASTPLPPSLAASARFYTGVPGHMEDMVPVPFSNPHVPMPVGRGQVDGANVAGSFVPMDPYSYNTFVRPPPPSHRFVQGYPKESQGPRENQPASSSHHILRLFPTSK